MSNSMKKIYLIGLWLVIGCFLFVGNVNAEEIKVVDKKVLLQKALKNYNKNITAKFVKTDIQTILKFFAVEFGLNIVSTPEVIGSLSFTVKDVGPFDAFDSVLTVNGYDWNLENKIIRVFKQNPVRIFSLNYVKAVEIASAVRNLVSESGKISINPETNILIIKDAASNLKSISKLIKDLDQPPRQVLVEVKVLELQKDFSRTTGINLAYERSADNYVKSNGFASTPGDSSKGMFVKVLSGDLSAIVNAVESNSKVNFLAQPKLLVLNHKKATINTGRKLGYKTYLESSSGTVSEVVNFLNIGTTLTFTPHISEDNHILMEIKPTISDGEINASQLPEESLTETETSVMVRDGQTILIGGLIRNKKNKTVNAVPFISDVPFIGMLFRKDTITNEKVETVILITPYIVTPEMLLETVPMLDELENQ